MIHIGIDPGAKGGVAVIDEQGELVQCFPYEPAALLKLCKKLRYTVNLDLSAPPIEPSHCTVEKTQAFPGMGVSGAHNYGVGRGKIEGILFALGIPYDLVTPSVWHRAMMHGAEGATAKARAWCRAQQLWPNQIEWFRKPRGGVHDGLVDAALIAAYSRRTHGSNRS